MVTAVAFVNGAAFGDFPGVARQDRLVSLELRRLPSGRPPGNLLMSSADYDALSAGLSGLTDLDGDNDCERHGGTAGAASVERAVRDGELFRRARRAAGARTRLSRGGRSGRQRGCRCDLPTRSGSVTSAATGRSSAAGFVWPKCQCKSSGSRHPGSAVPTFASAPKARTSGCRWPSPLRRRRIPARCRAGTAGSTSSAGCVTAARLSRSQRPRAPS